MNILYINNYLNTGGVTKCILKLSKEFNGPNKIVVASFGGTLLEEFNDIDVKYYEILDVENKSPHNVIKNILTIFNIVKKEEIHIIHSHHRMTTLLSKIVSLYTGVKVIHTQHSCVNDKLRLTKLALNNIPVIAVSEGAKKILTNGAQLNEENISVIYNTIELEVKEKEIDSILKKLKEDRYFVISQVGRLVIDKGIYDFIKIAQKMLENFEGTTNIRFVLMGDGPEKNNLQSYIHENNLDEYVFLLGNKTNVIEQLKYVDLVLLCSYVEGLPLSPLEAFSQGVPVIATNIDGTNEEIDESLNGFLVETKNIDQFIEKIILLYKDKNMFEKMKINAKNTYFNKFGEDIYIKKHEEYYKKTLNSERI